MTENAESDFDETPERSRRSFYVFVFLTFAAYIGLDLLTPYNFDDAWPALFLMTLVVGQLTLICVWGTLVEEAFWVRLPWTILLLVLSWAAICSGVYVKKGFIQPEQTMGLGLVWFYGFAISFIPLKIAAWLFGWRIRLVRNSQAADGERGRYAIRDIMIGTAILALALAVCRRFLPGDLPAWDMVFEASGLDNGMTAIAFVLFSLVSLIVKLPCIWIALAAAKPAVMRRSIVWVVCSGVLGLVELGTLCALSPFSGAQSQLVELAFSISLGHAAMAATMIAVLYGLRSFGYRMERKKKRMPDSTVATS